MLQHFLRLCFSRSKSSHTVIKDTKAESLLFPVRKMPLSILWSASQDLCPASSVHKACLQSMNPSVKKIRRYLKRWYSPLLNCLPRPLFASYPIPETSPSGMELAVVRQIKRPRGMFCMASHLFCFVLPSVPLSRIHYVIMDKFGPPRPNIDIG